MNTETYAFKSHGLTLTMHVDFDDHLGGYRMVCAWAGDSKNFSESQKKQFFDDYMEWRNSTLQAWFDGNKVSVACFLPGKGKLFYVDIFQPKKPMETKLVPFSDWERRYDATKEKK